MSLRSILTTPFTFTTDQKKEIAFGDEKTMQASFQKRLHNVRGTSASVSVHFGNRSEQFTTIWNTDWAFSANLPAACLQAGCRQAAGRLQALVTKTRPLRPRNVPKCSGTLWQ
jgi:hypothetical protein